MGEIASPVGNQNSNACSYPRQAAAATAPATSIDLNENTEYSGTRGEDETKREIMTSLIIT